jgi:Planctomycete cytochrome C
MKQAFIVSGILTIIFIWGCTHEAPLPDPGTGSPTDPGIPNPTNICFEADVLPIFQSYCAKSGCHDAGTHKEGYVLDNYTNIMKKGIVPGSAVNSTLYKVLFASGEDRMPPVGHAQMTDAQKSTIGIWINQGAKNTTNCGAVCDENAFAYNANIKPIMNTHCVGCHSTVNPSKGLDLSSYSGTRTSALNGSLYGSVAHASGFVAMPQGAAKLSPCKITVIQKWAAAGAPNN